MNKKAELLDQFLKDENITAFERKDFEDEDGSVVYRSYVQSPLGDMPFFVITDHSIYTVLRLVVGPGVAKAENLEDINRLINRENAYFKGFKYYIDEEDATVYMDCIYMAGDDQFEAALLYALMTQMVEHIPNIAGELKKAYHLEGRFESPVHHHDH
ncbi:MAG: hypothetical protein HUJ84_03475 [Veillonella sp.]|nr:hypothetical protein [Veillonella sp.]MCF0156299.1 hypothetical protein [Veillonella sp.]